LPDGQHVAIAEYGQPEGEPVFFCHGWPASRLQAGLLHFEALALGARIIAPDRPGIGFSPAQKGRRLRDWPALIGGLADALGLNRFRILGVSGGGPYALAAAWGLPERAIAAAVVCTAPPLADREDVSGLNPAYRWMLATYRRRPSALKWLFYLARPLAVLHPPDWVRNRILRNLPEAEAETLRDPLLFETCFRNYRESWSGGAEGLFRDAEIYAIPWDFPLEEIHVPVRLWHGLQDCNFSWQLAEEIAGRLPNCHSRFVEGEAHYSLAIRRRGEILADLLLTGI
jgi:pimeloyl-ACP methyl ester carboxylesterase